jgi:cold shock CspA family protein
VVAIITAVIPRGRAFTLGVLRSDGDHDVFVHKERLDSESAALERAVRVRERIRRGDLNRG